MFILMQSFVNSNLHVSTLYSLIIPKESEIQSLKIVQLQASGTFSIMSIVLGRTCSSLFLLDEYDILQNLKILLLFLGCPL
jgi:hypothetical protein